MNVCCVSVDCELETGLLFAVEPRDVVAVRGQPLLWHCSAVSGPGAAPPNVTWFKNGQEVGDNRRTVLANGTLLIRRVRGPGVPGAGGSSDEDTYECMAANDVGSILSRPALLSLACMSFQ